MIIPTFAAIVIRFGDAFKHIHGHDYIVENTEKEHLFKHEYILI